MPERAVEVPVKMVVAFVGSVLLMLVSIIGTLAWHVWTEHVEDFESIERIVDVLAGANPYKE